MSTVPTQARRLAAIVVSDVVGYSRMVERDEAGTVAALRELRQHLIEPLLAQHHGRLVKLMGDGAIGEFASVVDAVAFAVELQRAMAARNGSLPEPQRIILRMGINLGDVIVEGDDLLGDGVNVAARLEKLAEPGGICVSRTVVTHAAGKLDVGFVDLGEQRLKNIAGPVRVFRVDPDGAVPGAVRRRRSIPWKAGALALALGVALLAGWEVLRPTPAPALDASTVLTIKGPAIASLPFVNLSGDPQHDAFAAGMTEQVASALTRFKGFRVLSRRASAKYADDLGALRDNLGADYLLEGSVRRGADQVQVTALLTDVKTGAQIWTDSFSAALIPANIIAVQDQLAGQVTSAIASQGSGAINLDRLASGRGKPTTDLTAFDCVVSSLAWTSPAELQRAYACLQEAVRTDPTYAVGWQELSNIHGFNFAFAYGLQTESGQDPRQLALDSALRAVELAPDSSEAHRALTLAFFLRGNHAESRKAAERSMSLNPNDAYTVALIGQRLAFSGHWDEGVALIEKAVAFNASVVPVSAYFATAKRHYVRGEYAEALEELKKTYYPGSWLDPLNRAYYNSA